MSAIKPPLDLHDFRLRNENLNKARVKAEREIEKAGEAEAEAERIYLKAREIAIQEYEDSGTATNAKAKAEGKVADQHREWQLAALEKRLALIRLDRLADARAMLNREAEWSQRVG